MQPACSLLRDGRVAFQRDFRGGKRRGAKPSVQLLGNQGAALTTGTLLKEKGLEGVLLTEGETRGCGENFGHFTFRPGRAARPRLRPFCGISWQDAERVWGAQGDRFLLGITAIRPQASTGSCDLGPRAVSALCCCRCPATAPQWTSFWTRSCGSSKRPSQSETMRWAWLHPHPRLPGFICPLTGAFPASKPQVHPWQLPERVKWAPNPPVSQPASRWMPGCVITCVCICVCVMQIREEGSYIPEFLLLPACVQRGPQALWSRVEENGASGPISGREAVAPPPLLSSLRACPFRDRKSTRLNSSH